MSGEEHSAGQKAVIKEKFDQFGDFEQKELTSCSSDISSLTETDIDALKKFVEEHIELRMDEYENNKLWVEDYFSEDSDIANDESLEKTVKDHDELYSLIEKVFRYLRTTRGYDDLFGEVRTPFKKLPKHDARGEMVFLASEVLVKRNIPLWASHLIACAAADEHAKDLYTGYTVFDEGVYDIIENPSTWYRKMFSSIEDYMIEIMDQTRPIPDKPEKWDQYPYSCWGMKNTRRKMEDRVSVFPTLTAILPQKKDVVAEDGLFAVFDGHNGSECASYASVHFPICFIEVENFKLKTPDEIMTEAFASLTTRLNVRLRHEEYRSGSTAVCAHISNHKKLCIGWCGDSTAALMYSTSVEILNKSHVPDDPDEANRVVDEGGFLLVINGELRVNGVLNITRSLGDISAGDAISSVPSVLTRDLDGSEYLLVLGSDGLYDAFDGESIFAYVKHFVKTNSSKDYIELSRYLCRKASDEGSNDNISAICIFLRPVEDLWKLFSSAG